MTTQQTFEPHGFEAYAEAGNICRHCDRGKYALHHQTSKHGDHDASAVPGRGDDGINRYLKSEIKHLLEENTTLVTQRERLLEALDLAAKRIDFLTNWIKNSYGGTNADVELGRKYASAARAVITTSEQEGRMRR